MYPVYFPWKVRNWETRNVSFVLLIRIILTRRSSSRNIVTLYKGRRNDTPLIYTRSMNSFMEI